MATTTRTTDNQVRNPLTSQLDIGRQTREEPGERQTRETEPSATSAHHEHPGIAELLDVESSLRRRARAVDHLISERCPRPRLAGEQDVHETERWRLIAKQSAYSHAADLVRAAYERAIANLPSPTATGIQNLLTQALAPQRRAVEASILSANARPVTDDDIIRAGLGDPTVCEESPELRAWLVSNGFHVVDVRNNDAGDGNYWRLGIWSGDPNDAGVVSEHLIEASLMAHDWIINKLAAKVGRAPLSVLHEIVSTPVVDLGSSSVRVEGGTALEDLGFRSDKTHEDASKRWWVSWVETGCALDYQGPWWFSESGVGYDHICAAVLASTEEAAKQLILDAGAQVERWRYVQEKPYDWSPWTDRFSRREWMEWPDPEGYKDHASMLFINGRNFRCSCGANVFTYLHAVGSETHYTCNGCGSEYAGT